MPVLQLVKLGAQPQICLLGSVMAFSLKMQNLLMATGTSMQDQKLAAVTHQMPAQPCLFTSRTLLTCTQESTLP